MLQRGTSYSDKDGLLPQIRELQLPALRAHAAAAAVLAANPLDDNGEPRRQAQAKRVAVQRWHWKRARRVALEEGEQAVAELQQGGSPADASRIMSLQQKVELGTFAKQRLAGDAHASLTGGKALRTLDFERLFSDAPMLPLLVG